MSSEEILPVKKDVTRALLLKGTVFVHLDPREQDAVVPTWLSDQPQLVLQIGLDMPVPIPDLRVDEAGVFGTLSFKGHAFTCSVPWEAVFAVMGDDGRGMVWPDSMPAEIAAEVEREARRQGAELHAMGAGKPKPEPAVRPAAALQADAEDDELQSGERLRPALTVVASQDDEDEKETISERPADFEPRSPSPSDRPPHLRLVK